MPSSLKSLHRSGVLTEKRNGQRFEIVCGSLLILISSVSMLGWIVRSPQIVQWHNGFVAMVFNTALLFWVCGVTLIAERRTRQVLSAFIAVAGTASFLQYPLHVDFGIDQLLVDAWLADPNPFPGRMAPQTAICFVIAAGALFLLECEYRRWRSFVVHVSALLISVAGILSLIGYSVRLELLYSWYSYTRMAVQTAGAFTVLALGLWLRWYRVSMQVNQKVQREERRVNVIGIAIIVLVATTAGASGFVTLAKQTEAIALKGIANSLNGYVQSLAWKIEERRTDAEIIRNRPRLNAYIKERGTAFGPKDKPEIEGLMKSFLIGDIKGIAVYAQDGQLVSLVGTLMTNAQMHIPLNNGVQLLWRDTATLRLEAPLLIDGVVYGTQVVETRFDIASQLIAETANLGSTGDMRICSIIDAAAMQCLPTRLASQVELHTPRSLNGVALPASNAAEGKSGAFIFRDFRNHQAAGAYAPVAGTGLGIALFQDTDDLYAPIRENLQITLTILALVVTGAIMLLRWQIAPLLHAVVLSRAEADSNAARVATIMDNVPDGIITVNSQGHIISFNAAITRLFGYSDAELHGANIKVLMPPSLHSAHDTGFSNYLRTGERKLISRGPVEIAARRSDGSEFPIQLTLAEIQLNGERCFVGIMHDITKRREIDRLKSEFVSVVSHELRTPLTSIRGSLGLINSGVVGPLPEKVRHMIGIAYRNTDRLSHLINDILDMERIEAGRMDYQMKALKLQPLLEEAIEVNIGYAQSQQVRFVLSPSIPDVWINVDGHRFLQVMANLLSNAAKFSQPHTDVEIGVTASTIGCRVSIRDHGPGVPDDFHDKIFGKFCQANSSDQRSKTGTGLGLTISKAIVEQFGGAIGYDTVSGEGATFYFDLPLVKGNELTQDGLDASHAA